MKIDESAGRLERYLRVCTGELATFARLTGHADIHELSRRNVFTANSEVSAHTRIEHA